MPLMSAEVQDAFSRFWDHLVARPDGPMAFRFILQPTMAAITAIRDGVGDARTGRSPYFWTVLTDCDERNARFREGLAATSRIIALGLAMDTIYQLLVFGRLYFGEAVVVALGLAFLPYLLMRGPVTRVVRWWQARASVDGTH